MRILKISGIAVVLMIACGLLALWWGSRPPHRPPNLSANALYIERGVVPLKLSNGGEWLDCWFEEHEHVARCKLTNMNGWSEFEDAFLPYPGQAPLSIADVVLDQRRTGGLWCGTYEKGDALSHPLSGERRYSPSQERVREGAGMCELDEQHEAISVGNRPSVEQGRRARSN